MAMGQIARQLWRSRAWVMQYIGFTNNFALAILQYFLPIYCLVRIFIFSLTCFPPYRANCRGCVSDGAMLAADSPRPAFVCWIVIVGKVRIWASSNRQCLFCVWWRRRVDLIRCSQTQPTILRGICIRLWSRSSALQATSRLNCEFTA